jgi:YgiT-type zinc finger domain-containing protein
MKGKKGTATVECELCGRRAARVVLTPMVFGRGAGRVLIENVPVYQCRNCQGQYVEARSMDAIDEIRMNPSTWERKETIATAVLKAA